MKYLPSMQNVKYGNMVLDLVKKGTAQHFKIPLIYGSHCNNWLLGWNIVLLMSKMH